MKKYPTVKSFAVLAVFGFLFCALSLPVFSQSAATKTIIGFSAMAAAVEKNYGPLLELDLELKNGTPVYQAKTVINGQRVSLYLNAVSGEELTRKSPERLDYEDSTVYGYITGGAPVTDAVTGSTRRTHANAQQPKISYERAKEIALTRAGGGTIREIDLDHERGVLVYEIEVRTATGKYDVDVDAQTGEVLKFKQDW